MFKLFLKIVRTQGNIVPVGDIVFAQAQVIAIGEQIQGKIKRLFKGSLAIRHLDGGSDNACEQELVALSNAFYDIERFGIHFVASPRHADMLLVTGPISRNMANAVKKTYEATPDPKIVVAVGDDAINGGIFKGSYSVSDGVQSIIPVHYQIPGDPPSPITILSHILKILDTVNVNNKKIKTI